jgi:hypothetical protein
MGLSFTLAAAPRQRIHSQIRVQQDSWPHFTVPDSRLIQPGGPGSLICMPQEQVGPVICPGIGFPLVASYDSQSCSGDTRPRLHRGCVYTSQIVEVKSKSKLCYYRRSVGQFLLKWSTHLGLRTLSASCRLVDVRCSLWPKLRSAVISLLSVRKIYISHIIKCMYIKYTGWFRRSYRHLRSSFLTTF